jgi:hypothetical protein
MPCGAGELEIVLMIISIEQQGVEQPGGPCHDGAYPQTRG